MRKVKSVTIQTEGRDKGKTYLITEMDAFQAEKWAARALLAVARSGVELPEESTTANMAVLAIIGIKALSFVSFVDAEPLMNEMMQCVQVVPDPVRNPGFARPLVADDIEEVQTILYLRSEVFEIHTGFSLLDMISKSRKSAQAA